MTLRRQATLMRNGMQAGNAFGRQDSSNADAVPPVRTGSFYAKSSADVAVRETQSSPDGLSPAEAARRLARDGPNELHKAPPTPFWRMLLAQFSDLLVVMLMAAALVSLALGEYAAGVTIWVIIIANAALGVSMESKAGDALDALESMSSPQATAVRGGGRVEVPARDLVVGDLVRLAPGDSVPADCRLVSSNELVCTEAALTGEADGVKKDARWVAGAADAGDRAALTDRNMVYAGCAVASGTAVALVVHTGMDTRVGGIAHLLNTAGKGTSPLQQKLHSLGVKLGLASLAVSLVVFVVGVSTERGADPTSDQPVWLQMLLVAVSLTVAAVPEGLPAAVTITLAVGMRNMVKKHALIRDLRSVETLGSASVICSDKTGTLTAGVMTAVRLWHAGVSYQITGVGYSPEGRIVEPGVDTSDEAAVKASGDRLMNAQHTRVLEAALLCSNAELRQSPETGMWEAVGNMSERPIVVAAAKAGIDRGKLFGRYIWRHENPFSSARKMMSVVVQGGEVFVKGAPNVVLDRCVYMENGDGNTQDLTGDQRQQIMRQVDGYSSQAYRVIAVARRTIRDDKYGADLVERGLTLVGLLAYIDPERRDVAESIEVAHEAGIRVVMITGDYLKTAEAIAKNIGLLPRDEDDGAVDCVRVRELQARAEGGDARAETELDALTSHTLVYARAKPEDKITIVRSLQRQGHVCSMTGDGVNDAPALKQADIGVAMGLSGTDVAKGAASMVLTDDSFATIVAAVEEGRTVYANISKFVYYLLSTNVAEVLFILIAVVMGLQSPLVTIQILWLNLCTDGFPAIALAVEATEPGVMRQKPRPRREPIVNRLQLTGIAVQTATLTAVALGTYVFGLDLANGYVFPGDQPPHVSDEAAQQGVREAQTMTIYVIVFAELLRAYGSRSLRQSLLAIGPFTNTYMQWACGASAALTLAVGHLPGLRGVFSMELLGGAAWAWVLPMSFVPLLVDEATKYVYRRTGYC